MLTLDIKKQIKEYALKDKPYECIGLITQDKDLTYKVHKCRNISYHKKTESILDPFDWIRIESQGKIVANFHSQPNNGASIIDEITAFNHNLYSIIYCWNKDKFFIVNPILKDYLHRDFKIGENDCLSLVTNYYKDKKNIILNHYFRDENWFKNNPTIVYDNFKKDGFITIEKDKIEKDDIICLGNNTKISHLMIYLGNDLVLHHPRGHKSCIENLNHLYKGKISLILRYQDEK